MNKQLIVKVTSVIVTGALVTFGLGQGCGKWAATGDGSSDSASILDTSGDDPNIDPTKATVALVYGKQVLDHYTTCLGTGLASDRTLAMYSAKSGSISETGAVSTVTAPMLMASTSIAGEVCKDLIENEKTAPRILLGFNLAGTALPAQSVMTDAMRRLALSCWAREEDSTEAQIIMNAVSSSFPSAGANVSHDAALFMCTSMLSALDSLVL